MAVVKVAYIPTRLCPVVAIVADAGAIVEVLSQHGCIGTYAHAMIMLRNLTVGVVQ